MSNKVRILYLESDNADAETVGSLVGIVREVQSGGAVAPSVEHLAAPVQLEQPEPAALPAPAKRAYTPRAPKPAATSGHGAKGSLVLQAMAVGNIDRNKLAKQIYGDSGERSLKKLGHAIAYAVRTGKARQNADGTFTVIG